MANPSTRFHFSLKPCARCGMAFLLLLAILGQWAQAFQAFSRHTKAQNIPAHVSHYQTGAESSDWASWEEWEEEELEEEWEYSNWIDDFTSSTACSHNPEERAQRACNRTLQSLSRPLYMLHGSWKNWLS
ncbi:MAG: hypothetical protein ACO3DK_04500 [Bacteroidia bacterium]